MTCDTEDLEIIKGSTFLRVLRWESLPFIYKAITGVSNAAPARVTAAAHSVPDGWRVAVVSVVGMRQINAKNKPPRDTDFHKATAISANELDINDTNSADYSAYESGGYVQYYTPIDLSGYTARMMIRLTAETADPALVSLTTGNGGIALDNTLKTITLLISATATAALDFTDGVYDLELVSGAGVVTKLLAGNITVTDEVTK